MNVKRLTILRDALIAHAKNPGNLRFHLNTWASLPRKYAEANPCNAVRGAALGENFCGTQACALGLAASIPEFNAAGLRLQGDEWCGNAMVDVVFTKARSNSFLGYPEGFEAGERFFGLSVSDAEELFSPGKYRPADRGNPLAVAEKITALLETVSA